MPWRVQQGTLGSMWRNSPCDSFSELRLFWLCDLRHVGPDNSFPDSVEVASLKPSAPIGPEATWAILSQDRSQDAMSVGFLPVKGSLLRLRNRTLVQLVASAYRMRVRDVSGAGWMSELRFDVEAKLPTGASSSSVNEMLQALLEDRCPDRTFIHDHDLDGRIRRHSQSLSAGVPAHHCPQTAPSALTDDPGP